MSKRLTAAERKVLNATTNYWESRKGAAYYYYVAAFVSAFGRNARSIIDVGSNRTSVIEWFDWIPERYTVDIDQPYYSNSVIGIKSDFLTYVPEKKFDLAICSQVLEHIPDATRFARRLFEVADNVIITVPYKWPHGHTKSHIHDPVDEAKLKSWTDREPQHWLIAYEPLIRNEVGGRLIAYYHKDPTTFNLSQVRSRSRPVPELARPQIAGGKNLEPRAIASLVSRISSRLKRPFG